MNKNLLLLIILIIGSAVLFDFFPILESKTQNTETEFSVEERLFFVQENTLSANSNPQNPEPEVVQKIRVIVTAYSSTVWQTDNDPFITAAGTWVKDGIVANNKYPFGTKIRMPEIYGDKIFVVEDRMHWRKGNYHIDVWCASYEEAKNFGAKRTFIEILES
ncbi:3D domain-containing protein [Candidatus Parcubacteria bacterium]|nr:3D domain-containing protein [Candidatus Parcubacteria bacterium]